MDFSFVASRVFCRQNRLTVDKRGHRITGHHTPGLKRFEG
jgi:hypothetical protein